MKMLFMYVSAVHIIKAKRQDRTFLQPAIKMGIFRKISTKVGSVSPVSTEQYP